MKTRTPLVTLAVAIAAIAMPMMAQAAPSDQDTTWMAAAHQSNLAEIAAGKSAVANATSSEVRDLGQMFVDHHTALDADLTAAAQQLGVTLPAEPSAAQQAALASVEAQTGAAYDRAWVAAEIDGHQQTLAATQTEITDGSDPTVLALARAAAPVVQQHLSELQSLADTGGELAATGDPYQAVAIPFATLLVLFGAATLAATRRRFTT